MSFRQQKISQDISQHIGKALQTFFPGLFISVVKVEMQDLTKADIFLSIYTDNKEQVFKDVCRKKGEFKKFISNLLQLRRLPDIFFHLDDTIEYSRHISDVISSLQKEKVQK